MKRIIAMLIAAVMLLAMIPVVSVSAETVGDFIPVGVAGSEDDDQPVPLPGYYYDANGFHSIAPDLTNYTTRQTIVTRDAYNLKTNNDEKNGHVLSLEFVVDEFPYGGDTNEDEWISVSVWNRQTLSHGGTEYGIGYCTLLRGAGDGSAQSQNCLTFNNSFNVYSIVNIEPEVNADGKEVYTFALDYDGDCWAIDFCGTDMGYISQGEFDLDDVLGSFENDMGWLAITYHSGVKDAREAISITKFNGEVPYGDDTAEPTENTKNFAPLADSSTVPEGQPAVIWDSTYTHFKKFNGSNLDFSVNDNGTIHVKANSSSPYLTFGIKSEYSYEAADFPIIGVLTKNCGTDSGNCFYCAGDVMSAKNECSTTWYTDDVEFYGGWNLGIIDLDGLWEGRIHNVRIGFDSVDVYDDEAIEWDIGFIAMFRTEEDANAFAAAYVEKLYEGQETIEETTPEVTTAEATTAEQTTAGNADVTTVAGGADVTTAASGDETTAAKEDKGCGSVIGAFAVIAVISLGGVMLKKKD